ncbi:HAD-IA family hydrolase [Candidatus Pacearchaeota archaeon]|nr:HAD-IA family hydrolase [Candidatus Pacearchaeota archaeon]
MKKRETKNKIKAVIFDIGSVLVLSKHTVKVIKGKKYYLGIHETIARKLRISLDKWFDAIDTTYSNSYIGKTSKQETLSIISRNLKTTPTRIWKIVVDTYRENFKQNNGLYQFAFNLKKQGYKIAIISDQWHLSKEAVVDPKFIRKFSPALISCDVGLRKPDPAIYKLALKKLNLKPKECVFIDNQPWNIKPAKKLGMKTILFKNNKQLFKQLKKLGVK